MTLTVAFVHASTLVIVHATAELHSEQAVPVARGEDLIEAWTPRLAFVLSRLRTVAN